MIQSIKDGRQIFEKDSPRYFYNLWYEIIWDYSNRLLSEESDKLPGLAGLAKTLANMTGDEYVAGLWKRDISSVGCYGRPDDGTWMKSTKAAKFQDVQSGLFPPVSLPAALMAPYSTLDLHAGGLHPDLFLGYLDSDFWTEGYKTFHEISDTSSPDLSSDELMEEAAVVGNWNGDKKLHSDQEQRDCIGVIQYDVVDDIVTNQTVYVLALRQLEREPSWQDDTSYCVPTERDERGRPTQQYQVFGLALVPTGEADNEYRRIGLAEFITPSWFKEDSKRTVTIV
ncbi:heterokaryon incompatibility protein [Colletotrichum chrysophilum]|uniref:Heterokaryon incompatibility protein n=1 Tax=Colletotrichum chrysophilum TaxID=1836956 RepID=A0AAD9EJT2_9PEZI|nr:heterokaryon incompatibility protein [Colletotrichum chrysophilum]